MCYRVLNESQSERQLEGQTDGTTNQRPPPNSRQRSYSRGRDAPANDTNPNQEEETGTFADLHLGTSAYSLTQLGMLGDPGGARHLNEQLLTKRGAPPVYDSGREGTRIQGR